MLDVQFEVERFVAIRYGQTYKYGYYVVLNSVRHKLFFIEWG